MNEDQVATALHRLATALEEKQEDSFSLTFADKRDAAIALEATKILILLDDIDQHCRGRMKHGDLEDPAYNELETVRNMLWDSGLMRLLND